MGSKEDKEKVAAAAGQFPPQFGLRAFPGDRFKILLEHSYVSEGQVMLYTGIIKGDKILSFAKGTPQELRKEVVDAPALATDISPKADAWREVLHPRSDSSTSVSQTPKDLIDEQAPQCPACRGLSIEDYGPKMYPRYACACGQMFDAGEVVAEIQAGPLTAEQARILATALLEMHKPAPPTPPTPKDLIDQQASGDLRLLLASRMGWIDEIYPHGREYCRAERTAALEALIHLTHQLGYDCEGLLWEEDRG